LFTRAVACQGGCPDIRSQELSQATRWPRRGDHSRRTTKTWFI